MSDRDMLVFFFFKFVQLFFPFVKMRLISSELFT